MSNTRSSLLSSKKVNWHSSLEALNRGRSSKNIQKLNQADIHNIYHLIWVLPRSVERIPEARSFENIEEDFLFQGHGTVTNATFRPNFFRKSRGKAILYNGSLTVQDNFSNETLTLRWFNCYPNQKKTLEEYKEIYFLGKPSIYRNQLQIVSPEVRTSPFDDSHHYWYNEEDLSSVTLHL